MIDDLHYRALWAAVIDQALSDASGLTRVPVIRRRLEHMKLRAWALSSDLDEVCNLAGRDPARVRADILERLGPGPVGDPPLASWYHGLAPDVRDEIELTQLDRPECIKLLALMDQRHALGVARHALDRGVDLVAATETYVG